MHEDVANEAVQDPPAGQDSDIHDVVQAQVKGNRDGHGSRGDGGEGGDDDGEGDNDDGGAGDEGRSYRPEAIPRL